MGPKGRCQGYHDRGHRWGRRCEAAGGPTGVVAGWLDLHRVCLLGSGAMSRPNFGSFVEAAQATKRRVQALQRKVSSRAFQRYAARKEGCSIKGERSPQRQLLPNCTKPEKTGRVVAKSLVTPWYTNGKEAGCGHTPREGFGVAQQDRYALGTPIHSKLPESRAPQIRLQIRWPNFGRFKRPPYSTIYCVQICKRKVLK